MPTLSRMIATTIDGLVLSWLADRDDASDKAALDEFAIFLVSLATPVSIATGPALALDDALVPTQVAVGSVVAKSRR